MDDPILFSPDNRLLGSAIGDLGMYGGQSHDRFSVHEAREDAPVSVSSTAAAEVSVAPLQISGADAPIALEADGMAAIQAENGSGALAPTPFLIAPSSTDFSPAPHFLSSEPVAPIQPGGAPAETGSGSLAPVLDAPAPEQAASHVAVEAAHADALSDGPLMGPAGGLLDNLAAEPVAGGVTTLAADILAPVAGLAGDVLTGAAGLVDDTLEDLAGSDPLAGVETLVNLVSASDTFDLTPVVAPLLDTVVDTGQGLADALIGEDSPAGSLLGDHHDDGLLGGHVTPEHPLGL